MNVGDRVRDVKWYVGAPGTIVEVVDTRHAPLRVQLDPDPPGTTCRYYEDELEPWTNESVLWSGDDPRDFNWSPESHDYDRPYALGDRVILSEKGWKPSGVTGTVIHVFPDEDGNFRGDLGVKGSVQVLMDHTYEYVNDAGATVTSSTFFAQPEWLTLIDGQYSNDVEENWQYANSNEYQKDGYEYDHTEADDFQIPADWHREYDKTAYSPGQDGHYPSGSIYEDDAALD